LIIRQVEIDLASQTLFGGIVGGAVRNQVLDACVCNQSEGIQASLALVLVGNIGITIVDVLSDARVV